MKKFLAIALTLALAIVNLALAGALGQQFLCPGDDLVTVGGNDVDDAGNGSQGGQNFQNGLKAIHIVIPPVLLYFQIQYNQKCRKKQYLICEKVAFKRIRTCHGY